MSLALQSRVVNGVGFSCLFKTSRRIVCVSFTMLVLFGEGRSDAAEEVIRYQRLFSFGSGTNNGWQPWCPLIEGHDGALYGTTYNGGSSNVGVVFRLTKDGHDYRLLHHFGATSGDGRKPISGLVESGGGFLYGTTVNGGGQGAGTIFRVRPDGTDYAVLHNFVSSEGTEPEAALIEGSDGALYGTAANGGGGAFSGTVFAMNQDGGGFRVLHRFGPSSSVDGLQPASSLLEGSDGLLYGTTVVGGGNAVGSVFRLKKDGTEYKKLYAFGFNDSVVNPYAGLMEGSDHALYGTGAGGPGGVFKLNRDGTDYRVLVGVGGATPFGALKKGRDGALYTTMSKGGGRFGGLGNGSIFRIKEDGSSPQTLYSFGNTAGDGLGPHATLLLASDGAFYSTTLRGGDLDRGTVFRLLVNRLPVVQITNAIVSAGADCSATASIDNGSFDPDGDSITFSQSPPGPYLLGTNQVTLTVTDSHGDAKTGTAMVVVLDATPPEIQCPANTAVEFTSDTGTVVNYSVTATDRCDSSVNAIGAPTSGSIFPIGETEVRCTASDASGNTASCAFQVQVLGARGVKQKVLSELIAFRATLGCPDDLPEGAGVCAKLDSAIQHLRASLSPSTWVDETHLERKFGNRAFIEDKLVVNKLCELHKDKQNDIPKDLVQQAIDRVVRTDRLLASVAIADGIAAGTSLHKIIQAQRFLAKGDADQADTICGNGIEAFGQAWSHALHTTILVPTILPNGHTRLEIACDPGERLRIQASSNLLDWTTLGAGTADGNGIITFEDSEAAGFPARYYRTVVE